MALSSEENVKRYLSNGTVGPYAYDKYFLEDTDLRVTVTVLSTGVDHVKTLTTHYTVSGAGNPSGGAITWESGQEPEASSDIQITIERVVDYKQEIDYNEADSFPAETHERGLDKAAMQAQQLRTITNRTLRQPTGDPTDILELPGKAVRASKLASYDALGNPNATDPSTILAGGTETTGNWVPVLTANVAGDLVVTYTGQQGSYVKQGRMVDLTGRVTWSDIQHSTASGGIIVTGLPFPIMGSIDRLGPAIATGDWDANITQFTCQASPGTSRLLFPAYQAASGFWLPALITQLGVGVNGNITFTIRYDAGS